MKSKKRKKSYVNEGERRLKIQLRKKVEHWRSHWMTEKEFQEMLSLVPEEKRQEFLEYLSNLENKLSKKESSQRMKECTKDFIERERIKNRDNEIDGNNDKGGSNNNINLIAGRNYSKKRSSSSSSSISVHTHYICNNNCFGVDRK